MGRSRYKIYEPTHPHFITCTILHWIPIFTRVEMTDIIFESLKFLQQTDNLKVYAYVILENHLHLIASSDDIGKSMRKFKAHKKDTTYQLWQEGIQPKLIVNDKMMIDRINYIHQNPVKRGYIDDAKCWRYSSARDYEDIKGLIDIEKFF